MADDKKLTTRAENFSDWYNELVLKAEMADYSPVRGCMVIRPHGYGVWERMQRALKSNGIETAEIIEFDPAAADLQLTDLAKRETDFVVAWGGDGTHR